MSNHIHKRPAQSTAKWWLTIGGLLGVGALPCPECGTPMILHVWPLVGLVLVAQAIRRRAQKEKQDGSDTSPAKPETRVPTSHHKDRSD